MSSELIHTSAPRALHSSRSGFCTVGLTAGMSRPASSKLEMLSAYEYLWGISDPRSAMNPVNYCHTLVEIGGQKQSVLSRVAYSGADYSGRENQIAHHFLLTQGERLVQGPAAMITQMEQRGIFYKEWRTDPRELAERKLGELLGQTAEGMPAQY